MRLYTQNPGNWREQIEHITDEANALTGENNEHTKQIFIHLVNILKVCTYTEAEKPNFYMTILRGLREIGRILSYRGHPQRYNKQNKEMTKN